MNWGIKRIKIKEDDHILDIGCGIGGNIQRMLKLTPQGTVTGIDNKKSDRNNKTKSKTSLSLIRAKSAIKKRMKIVVPFLVVM